MNKLIGGLIALVVLGIVSIGVVGYNVDPEFTVVQTPFGKVFAVDKAGLYVKWFGMHKSYPDMDILYFSKDKREGSEDDESIETLFVDKGKAWWSYQVSVRNPTDEKSQIDFHRMCKGDYDYFRNTINARLKSASRKFAEKSTASDAAENQSTFVTSVEAEIKSNEMIEQTFHSTITAVELTGVEFDTNSIKLFGKQQEALLLKKQAELDEQKFKQQELSTKAEYAQKIEQQRGASEVEKMKAVTDAEREKQLAEIFAAKKVEVAKLEKLEQDAIKEKMLVEANRQLEVAKLERAAATENAEAQKVLADAREYQLQKGGAISERDETLAKINAQRDAAVAAELAKINVPQIVMGAGAGANGSNLSETMFQMKMMESMGLFAVKNLVK